MLQRAGYLHVTSTMDPTAVCELHRGNHYDLIVLDLLMPEMDGFQVMEALKEIETDNYLSVLVITAQPSHKLRAMQAGAKDFISKPFDHSEVLTRIHYMLEVRLLHDKVTAYSKSLEETVRERTVALRTSEEMFRELAANIPEALWIKDTEQQTIQFVNPAWQKLSGLNAVAGDPLEKAYQAIHPEDLQWVSHERRRPGALACNEYRLVRSDQSVRWVYARTFPIANPSGKVPWVVEIIEDALKSNIHHLHQHKGVEEQPQDRHGDRCDQNFQANARIVRRAGIGSAGNDGIIPVGRFDADGQE